MCLFAQLLPWNDFNEKIHYLVNYKILFKITHNKSYQPEKKKEKKHLNLSINFIGLNCSVILAYVYDYDIISEEAKNMIIN